MPPHLRENRYWTYDVGPLTQGAQRGLSYALIPQPLHLIAMLRREGVPLPAPLSLRTFHVDFPHRQSVALPRNLQRGNNFRVFLNLKAKARIWP